MTDVLRVVPSDSVELVENPVLKTITVKVKDFDKLAKTEDIQSQAANWCGSAAGTENAIELTVTPELTAYVPGHTFRFISSAANSDAVTVNISDRGAVALKKNSGIALGPGDIQDDSVVEIVFDGTFFKLREQVTVAALASGNASSSIGFRQGGDGALDSNLEDKVREIVSRAGYVTADAFNAAKVGKVSIDAFKRVRAPSFIAGDEELFGDTLRDSFVDGRNLNGGTNCHSFASRIIIADVTDIGTFGAYDFTGELLGGHNQNHVYGYQDRFRNNQSAGGVLQNSAGFISQTSHAGGGTILDRIAYLADPMVVTGSGTILAQRGFVANHMGSALSNVGFWCGQTSATGWAFYAPNGGKSYHAGQFGIGTEPIPGVLLNLDAGTGGGDTVCTRTNKIGGYSGYHTGSGKHYFEGDVGIGVDPNPPTAPLLVASPGGVTCFTASNAGSALFGAVGDFSVGFVNNGVVRFEVDAVTGHTHAGVDNVQSLGTAALRWSVVYAGSATILTSDRNAKQQIQAIDNAVMRACAKIDFCQYKLNEAVDAKGDAARWHFGVIAQDVKAAFESEGLDPFAYGLLCFDKWDDKFTHHPAKYKEIPAELSSMVGDNGKPLVLVEARKELVSEAWDEHVIVAGERYGVRYDELMCLKMAFLQSRVAALCFVGEGR